MVNSESYFIENSFEKKHEGWECVPEVLLSFLYLFVKIPTNYHFLTKMYKI